MVENLSVSIYPLQSTNDIILYTSRTSNPSLNTNSSLVIDYMSGLQIDVTTRKTIDIAGSVYDAEFLGDFIASEEICCDPIHTIIFTLENLETLWNIFKNNNNFLESRLQHIISLHKDDHIKALYTKSKSIKYFENFISTCVIKLLAYCELGNQDLENEEEKKQDEQVANNIWTNLLHSFCCLIKLNPLIAVKSGANLIKNFTQELINFRNNFNENENNNNEKINYNATKLLVVSTAVKKLVEQINAGVLSGNVKDTIFNINKNLKLKIYYF
jgi:hypothetical protein